MNNVNFDELKEVFLKEKEDTNGRYRSWEYCYKEFCRARKEKNPDFDYLSLQLAFYLASWGMYRGSSFLLEKDYKIHTRVVEEILKKEYCCLYGISCKNLLNEFDKLINLSNFISEHYGLIRRDIKCNVKSPISQTLVTKILMGTLGCVPAYDEYFVRAITDNHVAKGIYNKESLIGLVDFYKSNNDEFEFLRSVLSNGEIEYPQMKVLDMVFWEIGKKTKK